MFKSSPSAHLPLVAIGALFVVNSGSLAAPFTLTNLNLANGKPFAFQLHGESGTTNTIEASPTMSYWYPLVSGVAANGVFPYVHSGSTNLRRLFYRARAGDAEPAGNVAFQTDPNLSAMALITPESGGQCEVTTPDWIRFAFRAPSNSLPEPTIITMTVITNIVPLPGTNPPVAVRLEPSGLAFYGAAELEIVFPSNRPPGLTLSYSFGTNGTAIHLVPDLLSSNRIVIPVSHFSGFGSGQFTPSQVATYTRRALENATSRLQQRIVSILAVERQRQLLGAEYDPDILEDVRGIMDEYFEQSLKPALEAATVNCALAKTVVPLALGVLRQRSLLGVPDEGDEQSTYIEENICAALENCDSELDARCGTEPMEELLREALSLQRARVLLGCIIEDTRDWSKRFTNCVGQWSGIVRVSETGSTSESTGDSSQAADYRYSYTAYLADGVEDVSSPGTFMITGTLEVDASSSEKSVSSVHTPRNCPTQPGKTETTTRSLVGTGLLRQFLQVQVIGGEIFSISTTPDPVSPPELSALAMRGLEDFTTIYQHCDGRESRTTVIQDITDEGAPPLLGAIFDTGDIHYQTNSIRGTFTTTDTRNPAGSMLDVPTTVTWTVELRRRP